MFATIVKIHTVQLLALKKSGSYFKKWSLQLAFWKWERTITIIQRFLHRNSDLKMKKDRGDIMQLLWAKKRLCSSTVALKLFRIWVLICGEKSIFQYRRKKAQIIETTLFLTFLLPDILLHWSSSCLKHSLRSSIWTLMFKDYQFATH